MILLQLFWEFLKIGMFSVGGGMATLPFLYDLADSTGWYTYAQLADMLAVSESTPGPVGQRSGQIPWQPLCGSRLLRPAPGLHGAHRGRRNLGGGDIPAQCQPL